MLGVALLNRQFVNLYRFSDHRFRTKLRKRSFSRPFTYMSAQLGRIQQLFERLDPLSCCGGEQSIRPMIDRLAVAFRCRRDRWYPNHAGFKDL